MISMQLMFEPVGYKRRKLQHLTSSDLLHDLQRNSFPHWQWLPIEIKLNILSYLPRLDRITSLSVSKDFASLAADATKNVELQIIKDQVVPKLNAIKRWASELEMFPRSQSESIDHIWVASYYNQDYNTLLHQYYAMYKTPSQINANEEANIEYEYLFLGRSAMLAEDYSLADICFKRGRDTKYLAHQMELMIAQSDLDAQQDPANQESSKKIRRLWQQIQSTYLTFTTIEPRGNIHGNSSEITKNKRDYFSLDYFYSLFAAVVYYNYKHQYIHVIEAGLKAIEGFYLDNAMNITNYYVLVILGQILCIMTSAYNNIKCSECAESLMQTWAEFYQ